MALVHGIPKVCNLKETLVEFIKHREIVVTRRTQFLLKKAKAREHILSGLMIALNNIDAVIALIKKAKDFGATRAFIIDSKDIPVSWKPALLCLDCKVSQNEFWRSRFDSLNLSGHIRCSSYERLVSQ